MQVTTFTDCVNCLIAFTNNPHSLDVSLNAIAFLRFCAMKLAEGAIGNRHPLHSCLCPQLTSEAFQFLQGSPEVGTLFSELRIRGRQQKFQNTLRVVL